VATRRRDPRGSGLHRGRAYGLQADFDPTAAESEADAEANDALSLGEFLTNSRVLFTSAFAVVFAIIAVEGLYYRGMLTYLPEILHGLPAIGDITLSTNLEGISPGDYIYVSLLVVGMAGQYVGGKLTDRIRSERGLIAIFAVLCVLALAFVPIMSMGQCPSSSTVSCSGSSSLPPNPSTKMQWRSTHPHVHEASRTATHTSVSSVSVR